MKIQPHTGWLFKADSEYYSCEEITYDEKRLNHLAKFVKKAHDHQFLKKNPKPSYIRDRSNYKAWRLKKEDAALIVNITPYSYAASL